MTQICPSTKYHLRRAIEVEREIVKLRQLIAKLGEVRLAIHTDITKNSAVMSDLVTEDTFMVRVNGELWEVTPTLGDYLEDFQLTIDRRHCIEVDVSDPEEGVEQWIDQSSLDSLIISPNLFVPLETPAVF